MGHGRRKGGLECAQNDCFLPPQGWVGRPGESGLVTIDDKHGLMLMFRVEGPFGTQPYYWRVYGGPPATHILLAPSLSFISKTLLFIERCVGEWCRT